MNLITCKKFKGGDSLELGVLSGGRVSSRAVGGASSSGRIGRLFSFILSIALLFGASSAWATAEARSITGVERIVSSGEMFLNVTFEAGEPGDRHALYIAYDTGDKGADISSWAALQRGCNVAADATAATIPVSPLLTGEGYKVCRVFLTTSSAPYDTLIESLRQTGTQYIDSGIKPDPTTIASLDFQFSDASTVQQRVFGVSSDKYKNKNDNTALFSFDAYISGKGLWASACIDGKGDWLASGVSATTDRMTITLDAITGDHTVSNHVSGAVTTKQRTTTRTATSAGTMTIFAQRLYTNGSGSINNIAKGGLIYGGAITTNSVPARNYMPCALGGRAGLYDSVSGTIFWSAVATDFEAGGSPVACTLLAGETQLSAAPAATGLFSDYTWLGTASNWGDADAWAKDGENATWVEGNNAIFATANATATLADDVTANLLTFSADATVAGPATLTVPTVSVAEDASAVISAPIASAFEKTGAGTLTLTQNRTAATTVTEGTLKMDNATVADLTLGTYDGAPVALDYGGQELVRNPHDFIVTGSTVTLTNGIFSTESGADLSIRDDMSPGVLPSVLTIAKGATLRETTAEKGVYICKGGNGSSTINIAGGVLEKTGGTTTTLFQHKSVSGRVNINVTEGGLLRFPGKVYALCGGNIAVTSPSLYMTFSDSTFSVGGTFNFGSNYSTASNVPRTPTGVFAAANSVVSVGGDGFIVGRNKQDANTEGSYTVDFENGVVTAKTFAVYYDRPLNNARFNGTRFVFGAASGSFAASDDAANWITVGDYGLTLDTQNFSATLNANLGGSGAVTKVGTGKLTLIRNQTSAAAFICEKGETFLDPGLTVARHVTVERNATFTVKATATSAISRLTLEDGATLNIDNYDGHTPLSAGALELPAEGKVTLTLNGGAFPQGVYAICAATGVTVADGGKFAFATMGGQTGTWSVADGTLLLTVGDISGDYWTGRGGDGKMSTAANWLNGVPAEGADIDFSFMSAATTIIADTDRAFGTVTMGSGVVTFTGELKVKGFSNREMVVVGEGSTVTIAGNVTPVDQNRLCKTIQAGGTLHITGSVNITSSTIFYVLRNAATAGAIIVDGGIAVSGNGIVWWSSKVLALGENGISFTDNAPFLFIVNAAEVYALGERTVLGTQGRGKFRCKSDNGDVYLCTTQYGSNRPATITFDGNFNGVSKSNSGSAVNSACWGHWRVTGCGKVVCTSAAMSNRGLRVNDGATLAFNPNTNTFGASDQTFEVHNENSETPGGTLEVASSGTVTLTGDLSLDNGAALGFNFTDWNTPPQLALSNGKTLTANGAVNVKISGEVWPKGGEKILTTCGGFTDDKVSLAEGAPKWAKRVYVNEDGNIVLDVKPMGTRVIVR